MNLAIVAVVAGVIALAELPDKSLFASLVLSTRFPARWVFVGVASAFAVHVVIAVAAGGLISLLPHRLVETIVAVLFAVFGLLLLLGHEQPAAERDDDVTELADAGAVSGSVARRAVLTSFGAVFIGEWGDLTQIATANYAAKYGDPLSVGVGAVLGLWVVSGLAVTVGSTLLGAVPVLIVRRVTGLLLLGFAAVSAVAAVSG